MGRVYAPYERLMPIGLPFYDSLHHTSRTGSHTEPRVRPSLCHTDLVRIAGPSSMAWLRTKDEEIHWHGPPHHKFAALTRGVRLRLGPALGLALKGKRE